MEGMGVSKKVRFEIFKRDLFTCQYCGRRPPEVILEIDHVVPRCEGGTDDPANLTTSCNPCNRGKAGIPLEHVAPAVDELHIMANVQEMLERAQLLRQGAAVAEAERFTAVALSDQFREWWVEAFGDDSVIEYGSLKSFINALGMPEMSDALIAVQRWSEQKPWTSPYGKWKYFCGVCWTKIRKK